MLTATPQRRVPRSFGGIRAEVVTSVRSGRPVVLWCGASPQPIGVLAVAGQLATHESMAFMVRHCSGLVCVTVPSWNCARLGLPAMPLAEDEGPSAEMRVTVDAAEGIGTGISARDRARTARLLADPTSERVDFVRPGHVLPVRVDADFLAKDRRAGVAQAVADLVRTAGLGSAGVYSHLVSADGLSLADHATAVEFADRHRLPLVEQDLVE